MVRPVPVIETRRLIMRAWRNGDEEPLAAMNADPETMRYVASGSPLSQEESRGLIAQFRAEWARTGCGRWAVEERASGQLLGNCGIVWFNEATPNAEPEVAYGFRRESWGQGFATEAASAALAWVFSHFAAMTAVGLTHPQNARSQRVLANLGFEHAGTYMGRHGLLNVHRINREVFETHAPSGTPDQTVRSSILPKA